MRVLFVDQYAQIGGGQRILLDIVEDFKAAGWECVVALPEDGPLTEILANNSISVRHFPLPRMMAGRKSLKDQLTYFPAAIAASRELKRIAMEFAPDVVFCNGPRCVLPTVLMAGAMDVPVICAVHLIFKGRERALLSWCFRRQCVRAVTFCSTVAAEAFPDLPSDKRTLIGNWVSPRIQAAPPTPEARKLFGLHEGQIAVGVVGRLSRKKGQRLFLEAMAPLAHAMPNLRLLVAGSSDFEDPEEEAHLRTIAADLGMSYHVVFLGNVANTVALMDALDVLVVPSIWEEPFGLVAVEGMARGLPVVASRSGGLVDIVENGETGYLVERDAASIREAVKRLIGNPVLREEMGRKGLKRVMGAFSAPQRLEALRQMARNLLAIA